MDNVPAIISRKFMPTVAESDCFYQFKPSFLLNCFQIAAAVHSQAMGAGNEVMIEEFKAYWVLSRIHVRINRYSSAYQDITCRTYPLPSGRAFCLRDYIVEDENGGECAVASSMWTILDAKSHTLRASDSIGLLLPDNFYHDVPMFKLGKLPNFADMTDCQKRYTHRASYTDLDINMHVNNARYADFVLSAFTLAELTERQLHEFSINFLQAIKEGDIISVYRCRIQDDCYLVYGINDDTGIAAFSAEAVLIKRTDAHG